MTAFHAILTKIRAKWVAVVKNHKIVNKETAQLLALAPRMSTLHMMFNSRNREVFTNALEVDSGSNRDAIDYGDIVPVSVAPSQAVELDLDPESRSGILDADRGL